MTWEQNDKAVAELRRAMFYAREVFRQKSPDKNSSKEAAFLLRKFGSEAQRLLAEQLNLVANGLSNRKI